MARFPDLVAGKDLGKTLHRILDELSARRNGSEAIRLFVRDNLGQEWPDAPEERFYALRDLLCELADCCANRKSDRINVGALQAKITGLETQLVAARRLGRELRFSIIDAREHGQRLLHALK
jgi:hypothetical protein